MKKSVILSSALFFALLFGAWLWIAFSDGSRSNQQAVVSSKPLRKAIAHQAIAESQSPQEDDALLPIPTTTRRVLTERSKKQRFQDSPEHFSAKAVNARREMLWLHGSYLEQVDLPPDELETLKEILTREMLVPSDVNAALRSMDNTSSFDERQALKTEFRSVEEELKAFLGPQEFAKMHQMGRAVKYRDAIKAELMPGLYDAGAPLSPDQIVKLANVFSVYSSSENPEFQKALATPPDPDTRLTAVDRDIIARSSAVLSQKQMNVLHDYLLMKRALESENLRKGVNGVRHYKYDL